jgi:cell volume regulation protein A
VESIPALKESTFFGAFELNANVELAALAQNIGLSVPAEQADKILAEYIRDQLHTTPVVGDRVAMGKAEIVVKAVDDGHVTRVGLKI